MNNYICANETIKESDSKTIIAAIELAIESGVRKVRIPKTNPRTGADIWTIDETIALPSDIEILIDDAHLVLAEGKYLNMFTSGTPAEPNMTTSAEPVRNITIRGRGRAILDGGVYNGLSEKNCMKDGRPHISKNTTMLFFNTVGLTVENLALINQRWWAITNVFVENAVYRNIYFCSDFSRIDENGVHHSDEIPCNYGEIYIKNSDGIDLRIGCNNFLIENISGFTEDDSIALTALGKWERNCGYVVEGKPTDIHDVKIRNVATKAICANIRLLNDDGNKLYNIDIDGVRSIRYDRFAINNSTVRIGDTVYAETPSKLGDAHHISVKNVISEAQYGVSLCKGLCDSTIENVVSLAGEACVGTMWNHKAELERCKISELFPLAEGSRALRGENIEFIDSSVE